MFDQRTENPNGLDLKPLFTNPERVCIVALAHSAELYIRDAMTTHRMKQPYDEIWTLNRGIRSFPHDKLFCMDDLRYLAHNDNAYGEWLKKHDKPIITSSAYPEFPSAVPYPYSEVLETIGDDVFNVNTVAYMVALAIHLGVKELTIFGADFVHVNGNHAEIGGMAVTYLLGYAKGRFGLEFNLPATTTLLYANRVRAVAPGQIARKAYGYHRREDLPPELRGINTDQPPAAVGGRDTAGDRLRVRYGQAAIDPPEPRTRRTSGTATPTYIPKPVLLDPEGNPKEDTNALRS